MGQQGDHLRRTLDFGWDKKGKHLYMTGYDRDITCDITDPHDICTWRYHTRKHLRISPANVVIFPSNIGI